MARDSSSVKAWDSSSIHVFSEVSKIILCGFSVAFKNIKLKCKIQVKSKTAIIQNIIDRDFFDKHGIKKAKTITLYKKVSKDYKTQENTKNETLWAIGSTVNHPSWNPSGQECGEGKFHACATPYFCDEFRSNMDDHYIAIQINMSDIFEWKDNLTYPHKIAFRKCKVLYECDRFGDKIEGKIK